MTANNLAPLALLGCLASLAPAVAPAEDLLTTAREPGRAGGGLVVAQRAEPKTLNPVMAPDSASREVINRMMADLIHINRETHRTEPALARSWDVANGGRRYVLHLRRGLRFSDGHAFDASDVVFTFQVLLDPKTGSPQRDLLVVAGRPIAVRQQDAYTVVFDLAGPYAAAERIFDSIAILPRHLLEQPYREGKLARAWGLNVAPGAIAGLGPFRLKQYLPGQRIVLERNPYYWKKDRAGRRLPYLDTLTFLFVGSEDAQVLRFEAGETDVVSRIGARNFAALEKNQQRRGYALHDLGPGLEYNFLFFNLNEGRSKQSWFGDANFRRAVSAAIDREGIVKLVYNGRAAPLWGHVTPGNRLWVNATLPHPARSLGRARELLRAAGFSWNREGALLDRTGARVEFTIAAGAGNPERTGIATIVQDDLKQIGIRANVAALEFRALLDRLLKTFDYEAAVLGLGSGDVDPTAEMNVWLSSGGTHLWRLNGRGPAPPWEAEIDTLMRRQMVEMDPARRKRLYDRVQQIAAGELPIICVASPNILVGAKTGLGNFRPAILDHYTLWNVEELYWRAP
ncbi:MAG: ABC transporter substrate-binding protein [Bryobacteraceae bacterium]